VTSIAYPFGQYDERVVRIAREAGFTSGRSTWPGVRHTQDGLLSLTSIIRTDDALSLIDSMERYLAELMAESSGS
jgi:hypothetical protein